MREIEVDYMNINEVFSGLDKLFAENRLPEVERYLTQHSAMLNMKRILIPCLRYTMSLSVFTAPRENTTRHCIFAGRS